MLDSRPICAIATAPGNGGIGVIRLSGVGVATLIPSLFSKSVQARQAVFGDFVLSNGEVLDQGILIYFPAPHSYTGEHVVELQAHGGQVVLNMLLQHCLDVGREIGLRLAEPGEFTQRAFLNGKLDLTQAEAVADLISASTEVAVRSAGRSLSGIFSAKIHALVDQVIYLRMLVEATLDFPEEEIDFLEAADATKKLQLILDALDAVLMNAKQGALLRNGLHVVLVGAPNVGKSSLLNALSGTDVAIVTPIAGTTRDKVTQTVQLQGIPLHVIDTAGLREATDEVEQIGIQKTWQEIDKADVIVHLRAADIPDDQHLVGDIRARLQDSVPYIEVFNKIDLLNKEACVNGHSIYLSVKSGMGLDLLHQKFLEIAGVHHVGEQVFMARTRHLTALNVAKDHLNNAYLHLSLGNSALDLCAEELRLTQESLNSITGEFSADDLLGEIFSKFCIGK